MEVNNATNSFNRKRGYRKRLTEEQTLNFIRARIKLNHKFAKGNSNKQELWEEVAREIGLDIPYQSSAKKWSNLLLTYKKCLSATNDDDITDEDEFSSKTWPYFNEMHKWASMEHNLEPMYLISSEKDDLTQTIKTERDPETILPDGGSYDEEGSSIDNESHADYKEEYEPPPKKMPRIGINSKIDNRKRRRDVLEELIQSNRKLEKKMNVLFKGISKICSEKFNITLDFEDSDDE